MNILLVAPQQFFTERGTPIAVRQLAETLCAAGHRVDLLTYHTGVDIEIEGLRILRIPAIPGIRNVSIGFSAAKLICDAVLSVSLLRAVRRKHYAVIHAVEEAIFPALLLGRHRHTRIVYDMDSSMAEQLMEKWPFLKRIGAALEFFENQALRRADLIMPVCQYLADKAARVAPGTPVHVVHDTPLPGHEDTEDLRSTLAVSGVLALYVGNLERYQGVDLLLDGLAALPADTVLTVVIVGGTPEAIARYRQHADRLNIGSRIHLIGPRPLGQLSALLTQADILVSPRLHGQNTPMKIYSYMAAGKAILATAIGSHEQVLDEQTALLCAAEPQALAAALVRLTEDADLRNTLGSAARNKVEREYSETAYRHKIAEAYSQLRADTDSS